MDAASAGHDEPARALLHGRGLRLFPADRDSAVEAAAADADETGAGVRPRCRARDPEPGRSRLQGARQRGHMVHRPAADRARQGTRDRRSAGCGGDRGSGSQGAGNADGEPRATPFPHAQRAGRRARPVRDALGAVVSAWPSHADRDRAADAAGGNDVPRARRRDRSRRQCPGGGDHGQCGDGWRRARSPRRNRSCRPA